MVTDSKGPDVLVPVTKMELIDVSGVRDPNMQALILLARSLDWNVMQKVNQPVVITSRSGIQRRIPTNTSIRMSVFQTHLSAIVLHSSLEPTIELMNEIIKSVKPDREHQNRLRLAVGQTLQEHRRAVDHDTAAEQLREPEEHLTQTPEITWEEPPMAEHVQTVVPTEGEAADGGVHGAIMTQHPFLASVNTTKYKNHVYESVTSIERVWEDGYIDFVCTYCGAAKHSPKGVGSHFQMHTKAGALKDHQGARIKEHSRVATPDEQEWIVERNKRLGWGKHESKVTTPPIVDVKAPVLEAQSPGIAPEDAPVPMSDADRIELILAILLPDATKQIEMLMNENDDLSERLQAVTAERDKLKTDLSALRDILKGIE